MTLPGIWIAILALFIWPAALSAYVSIPGSHDCNATGEKNTVFRRFPNWHIAGMHNEFQSSMVDAQWIPIIHGRWSLCKTIQKP